MSHLVHQKKFFWLYFQNRSESNCFSLLPSWPKPPWSVTWVITKTLLLVSWLPCNVFSTWKPDHITYLFKPYNAFPFMQENPEPLLYLQASTWDTPKHHPTGFPVSPLWLYFPLFSFLLLPSATSASVLFIHMSWKTSRWETIVLLCAQLMSSITPGTCTAFPDHLLPTLSLNPLL